VTRFHYTFTEAVDKNFLLVTLNPATFERTATCTFITRTKHFLFILASPHIASIVRDFDIICKCTFAALCVYLFSSWATFQLLCHAIHCPVPCSVMYLLGYIPKDNRPCTYSYQTTFQLVCHAIHWPVHCTVVNVRPTGFLCCWPVIQELIA